MWSAQPTAYRTGALQAIHEGQKTSFVRPSENGVRTALLEQFVHPPRNLEPIEQIVETAGRATYDPPPTYGLPPGRLPLDRYQNYFDAKAFQMRCDLQATDRSSTRAV
jgi:hypothetical protein